MLFANTVILSQNEIMPPKDYKLIWSDEFNGDSLDMSKWSHRWLGKRKLGYTTEDSVKVDNGTLKIIIHKNGDKYCSGMIGTQGKFETKYGYFEMKAKLPKIKGPQSAFWLMSPNYGKAIGNPSVSGMEIDIMEYVKTSADRVHFTTHWDGYGDFHKKNYGYADYMFLDRSSWHTFGLLWTKDSYKFYVDGKLKHQKSGEISNVDQYIILSAEIGEWGGDISHEVLPDQFEVDYVRVYQRK
jgi:beta-glucanase (GH16 family)